MATTPPKKTAGRKPVAAKKAPAKSSAVKQAAKSAFDTALRFSPAGPIVSLAKKTMNTYQQAKPAKGESKMSAGTKAVARKAGQVGKTMLKNHPFVVADRLADRAALKVKEYVTKPKRK